MTVRPAEIRPLGVHELEPLLDLVAGSDPAVRRRALDVLTVFPLTDAAWRHVARIVLVAIELDPHAETLVAAAQVPVREVREQLHAQLGLAPPEQRTALAQALVAAGDAAAAPVLVRRLAVAEPGRAMAAAEALGQIAPAVPTGLAREIFEQSKSDDVRLWLAVHLARGGDIRPLQQLIDEAAAGSFRPAHYHGDSTAWAARIEPNPPMPRVVIDLTTGHGAGGNIVVDLLTALESRAAPGAASEQGHLAGVARTALDHAANDPTQALESLEAAVAEHGIKPPARPHLENSTVDLIALEEEVLVETAPLDDLGLESLGPVRSAMEASPPDAAAASGTDHVYALLKCPGTVAAEQEFELAVGLSPAQSEGVVGGPLEGLEGRAKPYVISVQVVADGFELREGERWRHDLAVTDAQPFPTTLLHLRAVPTDAAVRAAAISATFTVDGQMVGMAVRPVAITAPGVTAPEESGPQEVVGADLAIPTGPVPADLTVAFHQARELHLLRMTIESPHDTVRIPEIDVEVSIGADPDEYARELVRDMDGLEGSAGLRRELEGRGRMLSQSLPEEFWAALREAAEAAGGRPSVLLVSAEGRIPWELALVDPPLDPDQPPFLSTQAVIGRWVLAGGVPLPPPHERPFGSMAVITGDYTDLPRWDSLAAADNERDELHGRYQAEPVDAKYEPVIELLERKPAPTVLHLAVHGKYTQGSGREGIVLTDGEWLTPNVVMAQEIEGEPLVFLNACQVGSSDAVLNQYAGLAPAFLRARACGVIAPMWSVKDEIARNMALGFYTATLEEGVSVGEAIRRARSAFAAGGEPTSATFMAYQYFGHPELRLAPSDPGGG